MIFLNLAIWLPILAGVVLLALGRDDNARAVRWLALLLYRINDSGLWPA